MAHNTPRGRRASCVALFFLAVALLLFSLQHESTSADTRIITPAVVLPASSRNHSAQKHDTLEERAAPREAAYSFQNCVARGCKLKQYLSGSTDVDDLTKYISPWQSYDQLEEYGWVRRQALDVVKWTHSESTVVDGITYPVSKNAACGGSTISSWHNVGSIQVLIC